MRVRTGGTCVVDLPPLRPFLSNAARLLVETMIVPTVLLYVMLRASGLIAGLLAALGWYYLCATARWIRGRRLPGAVEVAVGAFTTGACMALVTSSAVLAYLVQPILGSCCMAGVFLGSALVRRPITAKLAMDLIRLPAHTFGQPEVARVLHGLAMLWGLSRLADAAVNYGLLHSGAHTGLLTRGALAAASLLVCAGWARRALRANGVELRRATAAGTRACRG
jgi:hypothetical protein